MDRQILHQRLQEYYFQQTQIRTQQKKQQQYQQHQQHAVMQGLHGTGSDGRGRGGSPMRKVDPKGGSGSSLATLMAAANAGIVAVGPVPLDLSRMAQPPPAPPQSSPAVQSKQNL